MIIILFILVFTYFVNNHSISQSNNPNEVHLPAPHVLLITYECTHRIQTPPYTPSFYEKTLKDFTTIYYPKERDLAPALSQELALEIMTEILKKLKITAAKMCDAKDGEIFEDFLRFFYSIF